MNNDSKVNSGAQQKKRGKKRGLKPRSQRNRKKPRGGVGLAFEEGSQKHEVQIDIIPLPSLPANERSGTGNQDDESSPCRLDSNSQLQSNNIRKRIRVVRPYPFTFATFSKARWLNRKILDVYHEEFGSFPRSYYESAIREGRILVSGKRIDVGYLIKGQDELTHTVHRHEPVVAICDDESIDTCITVPPSKLEESEDSSSKVTNQKNLHHFPLISVIYEDEDVIVVDKPSTLPVHPSGGYNFNSLCHILSEQDPSLEGKLHNVHRLDRLTSGLTIVAKSTEVAKVLGKCVQDRENCHKVYLARVKGKFPLVANDRVDDLKVSSLLFDNMKKGDTSIISPCINGEWVDPKFVNDNIMKTENAKDAPKEIVEDKDESLAQTDTKKSKNDTSNGATCFWITNDKGEIQQNASLEDVFKSRADVRKLSDNGTIHSGGDDDDDKDQSTSSSSSATLWLNLCVPCEIICHKNGVCKAGRGKPAQTAFTVLNYDKDTDSTTLLVKPQTGRTHQIRIHLQYLGHPIANDHNYGGELFYGDATGKALCQYARQRMDEMDAASKKKNDESSEKNHSDCPVNATSVDTPATEMEVRNAGMHKRIDGESLLNFIVRTCVWCQRSRGGGGTGIGTTSTRTGTETEDRSMLEFLVRSPGIWLHAFQYSLVGPKGKIVHRTNLPKWCLTDNNK